MVNDTLVPDAIESMAVMFRAAVASLNIPASAVFDGPPTGTAIPMEYVCVGWSTSGPPDVAGVAAEEENAIRSEEFDVLCQVSVASGDTNVPALSARAGVILSAIGTALRADRELGGLLSAMQGRADRTGAFNWERGATDAGMEVTVSFVVHVSVGWLP